VPQLPQRLNSENDSERGGTEETLRLLNSAVFQSKESILITDAQLDLPGPSIVFVNPAFTRMTGYSADEVLGKTPRILQGLRTDKAVLSRLRRNLERGEAFEGEAINYRKDGTEFMLEWQIAPIRDSNRQITHFVATQRDITARKQSEIAANRLAAIVESSEDAIIGKDMNGIVSSWNRGAEKIFGYAASEMIGTPITRLIPADRQHEENDILERIRRGQSVEHFETLRQKKDGRLVAVSVTASPIKDSAGKVIGVSKVAHDITERKHEEGARRATEARYRALFEHAPDGLIIVAPDTTYLDANPSLCRMLGYTREEMIGRRTQDIVVESDIPKIDPARKSMTDGKVNAMEWRLVRKDGSIFDTEVSGGEMPDGNRLGIFRDITKRKADEEALRDSELRFATAFRSSPAALAISRRRDMANLDVNETFLRIFECTRDDIIGKTILQTGMLDAETLQSLTSELDVTGIVLNREIVARTHTGRPLHAILSVKIIELGGEPCSLSILIDITDRKLTEEKLRSHEAILQETGHIAKVGGWSFEVATGQGYWTDEVARIHDLEPATPASKEIGLSFYRAESRKRIELALHDAVQNGTPYDLELEITSAVGTHKWVRTIGHPITEQGKVVHLRGSFQDITERKKAEMRLKLQHAVTEVLAEGGSLERTSQKVIETLGKGLGWDIGELWKVDKVGNLLRRSEAWNPPSTEYSDIVAASANFTFEAGQGLPGRVWASGRATWIPDVALDPGFMRGPLIGQLGLHGWIGFPVMLRNEVLGVVGFFNAEVQPIDSELLATLTTLGIQLGQFIEKQQLAEQFRQAQKMDAIGTLAGGIAHDFNNILAVIMGYSELIKMTVTDNPRLLEYIDSVEKAGSRATKLVRQILTFSRQEETKREILQLGPVVEEALKFLRSTIPSAIEFKVALSVKIPTVLADSTQVHQIVMNLGTNAWHAMKGRSGRLEVKLENFEVDADFAKTQLHVRPGSFVRLSVSDTGKGMDRATINRIFEPFFTTKPLDEGTGLGLSVVHGIMQGHDGAITVYSQPDEGTTFNLYFPAVGGEVLDLETHATPIPLGKGERILIVDDEEPLVLLAQRILVRLGYVVETRTSVAEALELVRAGPDRFDLVITDMTMPAMSGIDFAQQLTQIRPSLRVILTTGYPGGMKLEQVRAMGIRELLLKPPTIQSIGTMVHRVLVEGNPI
jgi:PAS domain S-box-containing protein